MNSLESLKLEYDLFKSMSLTLLGLLITTILSYERITDKFIPNLLIQFFGIFLLIFVALLISRYWLLQEIYNK